MEAPTTPSTPQQADDNDAVTRAELQKLSEYDDNVDDNVDTPDRQQPEKTFDPVKVPFSPPVIVTTFAIVVFTVYVPKQQLKAIPATLTAPLKKHCMAEI